ncbi:J domain-containing protein [Corallococcus sp. Z5C101001]|nr:DnaJ domain-containing protein [Corallococcus silvisoli]TSC33062.1 J domain-containing protein [Corallococcus sp. Z5C101001]
MAEALRRSASVPLDPWLTEESSRFPVAPPPEPDLPLLEVEPESWGDIVPAAAPLPDTRAPAPVAPVVPVQAPPQPDLWAVQPPKFPAAASPPVRPARASEDDLWRIVSFDESNDPAQNLTASFEAALQQVDAHLEALIRSDVRSAGDANEFLVEAIVEATFEPLPSLGSSAFPGDNGGASGQTEDGLSGDLDDWDFDEDDVAAEDPSNPDEASKLRRQRLLRRAMENMGTLGARPVPPTPAAPPASPEGAAPPPAAVAAPPEPPKPDEGRLAQQIEQRYADIQAKKDHFVTLGVPHDASRDQVKAAFLSLAKLYHPDRLPPSLPHLAQKMTSVFESIREAYEVLHDDTRRKNYVLAQQGAQAAPKPPPAQARPGSPGTARPNTNADDLFRMGEVFFRKRDFVAASEHYERANALDPRPVYLAAHAWSVYMDPARKADMPRAKQWMADAVRTDPNCDRAHYQLGVIARVEGDMDRAERHFREAVRANPKHLEANQELRLIDMRKKNPPKKGLFR